MFFQQMLHAMNAQAYIPHPDRALFAFLRQADPAGCAN